MKSKIMRAHHTLEIYLRSLEAAVAFIGGDDANIDQLPAALSGNISALGRSGAGEWIKYLNEVVTYLCFICPATPESDVSILNVGGEIAGALLDSGISKLQELLEADPDELAASDRTGRLQPPFIIYLQGKAAARLEEN